MGFDQPGVSVGRVSVVIPTVGRPSLVRAVRSALDQVGVLVEIIVVEDGRSSVTAATVLGDLVAHSELRLLATGEPAGAATARAVGTQAAVYPWVAYLDDDDAWHPDKLARQLQSTSGHDREVILSCRTWSSTSSRRRVVPRCVYRGGDVAAYLFKRRRLRADRNLIHTSSLLCPTRLARDVGWTLGLPRHQDWDFLLRCVGRPGVTLRQLDAALVETAAGSVRSISSSDDWSASLAWARSIGSSWEHDTYVDFLVGQPLRYALSARSLEGVKAVLAERRGRGTPSLRACVLAVSGLIPRSMALRFMHR